MKPTSLEMRSQILQGLSESARKHRQGKLTDMQIGSTIRRARHNGITYTDICFYTMFHITKVKELENAKYVGG